MDGRRGAVAVQKNWTRLNGSNGYIETAFAKAIFLAGTVLSNPAKPDFVYLDHAATTPLLPAAAEAMARGFAIWANPSSPHRAGRAARAAIEDARARIAAALGWTGEVILTSGASEALALALRQATVDRRIISAVEHDAVFRAAPDAHVLPMESDQASIRALDPAALEAALGQPGRAIVAIQLINSETGTAFLPVSNNPEIEQIHAAGGLVLCDASQIGFGRSLPRGVDMAVISGHKIGGPIGIGALLVRDFAMLAASGGQERGYRQGTENLPGALGLAAALEAGEAPWRTTRQQRSDFRDRLRSTSDLITAGVQCVHIFALTSDRHSANALLIRVDAMGFGVSAGSACSSGSLKPSRVLAGFGVDPDAARRTIRVSLGWSTTPDELDAFAQAWEQLHA